MSSVARAEAALTDEGRAVLEAIRTSAEQQLVRGLDAVSLAAWIVHRIPRNGYEVRPIEQASVRPASPDPAEAADVGTGHDIPPTAYPDDFPSVAVAPLEPIPTDWGVGPLTHPAAVAPSSAEVGGSLDVEALAEGLHGQLCSMGQDHRPYDNGDLTCVAVATAAYADAIRKRDPSAPADPTGGGA